jgi:hypothetical protein
MHEMPASVRPILRRLARRLAIGLFLDRWPTWAAASLLLAGLVALICRLFFPRAASILPWLWLAPILTAIPVLVVGLLRAYRPADVIALADWLGGGQGLLLTLFERDDPAWAESPLIADASRFALPRFHPWRKLAVVLPAAAFLAAALVLPQRTPAPGTNGILADEIAADLAATIAALKQQDLITPAEEQRLEEEIERIRRGAEERVDASSWEAADALREQVVASLSEKQEAVEWAQESLARYAAAAQAGAGASADAHAAELAKALEKLAGSGMLAGASADLQRLLKDGKLPANAGALGTLTASLAEQLAAANARMAGLGGLGNAFGRFDPSEFPLASGSGPDGDGDPGRGGINRGRADAPLTWGKESLPFDRFKAQALPPGAARTPDDWAPVVVLPGAPQESATASVPAEARQYAAAAGQTAWRRSLAPRHQSAVKKYFEK